jgi:hypothetical protein
MTGAMTTSQAGPKGGTVAAEFTGPRLPGRVPDDIGEDTGPAGLDTGDGEQAGRNRNEDSSG